MKSLAQFIFEAISEKTEVFDKIVNYINDFKEQNGTNTNKLSYKFKSSFNVKKMLEDIGEIDNKLMISSEPKNYKGDYLTIDTQKNEVKFVNTENDMSIVI